MQITCGHLAIGLIATIGFIASAKAEPLDQTVGQVIKIDLNNLAEPNPEYEGRPREMNFSRPRERTPEDRPIVPEGFSVALYA